MSTFIFDLVKNIDFLENTNFSAFSTVTRGFDILNENGTSLIPKTVVSSFCTRTKSSTSNKIILVLIKITGGVGATLVFVNIFLCVHDHCKRKRSISTHQKSLKISTSYGIRQSNIKFEKEGSAFFNNSLILKK